MASLFLAARLRGAALPQALGQAASATWRVLAASVALGADELALVPALDSLLGSAADAAVEQVA
jgi:pyridoxal/pyridoxine/pyridoxamine kinase